MTDDVRRFEALLEHDILDTPPEAEFDDIVFLAQKFCKTSCALVSFVAIDRQWFKAKVGFDPCETPIGQSVCSHALKGGDLLVIPDLTQDPRTKHNALVIGAPHLRFYAGAVLRTADGIALGTICVIDDVPRLEGLTLDQAEVLRVLARQTMGLMAMRRAVTHRDEVLAQERSARDHSLDRALASEAMAAKLRKVEGQLREAQSAGGIGTFEVDIATDLCVMSPEFCRIFGLEVTSQLPLSAIQALVMDRDHGQMSTVEGRTDGSADREIDVRIRRANDGAERWIWRRADFQTDENGQPRRMLGIVQDITERKLRELRSRALILLGDALRDATAIDEVIDIASRALGETLSASRAGYAVIDVPADILKVERDWTAGDIQSIVGQRPLQVLAKTVDRLKQGVPLAISNVPAAGWLAPDLPFYLAINTMAQIKVPLLHNGQLVALLFVHSARARTWTPGETDFAHAVADRTHAMVSKLQAEVHQRLMNEELSHRLKNTLALVQAIAGQTLRSAADKPAVRAFEDRLIALSRAHDVLLEQSWTAARILAVIERVLGLHGHEGRFDIAGPNLTLGPKATLSLSLLLHELATNAVKYGALSKPGGRVLVHWRVGDDGPAPNFIFSWGERGGPPAQAPKRRGFGSKLIAMGIAGGGKAVLDYAAQGLTAEFSAPMTSITDM